MKIACWNVNSVKSRLEHTTELLEQYNPDILLLQELKCEEHAFPHEAYGHLGYNHYILGQKTYNGVAVFSKYPIDSQKTTFPGNPCPEQARFLEVSFAHNGEYYRVTSVYVPNGGEVHSDKFEMKLKFFDALHLYLNDTKTIDENIIIGGDFNVAPFDLDVHAPQHLQHSTCFTIDERTRMRTILNDGYFDLFRTLYPEKSEYSWWDYRARGFEHNQGMRIDMILGNANVADKVKEFIIDKNFRGLEKASDHAPMIMEF